MFKLSDVEIAADQRWQDYVHPEISSRYKGMYGVFQQNHSTNIHIYIYNVQSFLDDKGIIYLSF